MLIQKIRRDPGNVKNRPYKKQAYRKSDLTKSRQKKIIII